MFGFIFTYTQIRWLLVVFKVSGMQKLIVVSFVNKRLNWGVLFNNLC